jgi:hypothetical protein
LIARGRLVWSLGAQVREDMKNKTLLRYSEESVVRVTPAEESFLIAELASHSYEEFKKPWLIVATEGYDLHICHRTSSVLVVGCTGIYERMTTERLHNHQKTTSQICGLYYPSATPPKSLLFQASL